MYIDLSNVGKNLPIKAKAPCKENLSIINMLMVINVAFIHNRKHKFRFTELRGTSEKSYLLLALKKE